MRNRSVKRQRGLTLAELLIGLIVVALVLVIGIPNIYDAMMTNRMANLTNTVLAHLQYTRMEAVTRNTQVRICPSADGANCDAQNLPQDWANGFIVAVVSPFQVLRRVSGEDMAALNITSCGRARFTFGADGTASGNNGRIRIWDPDDNTRFRIIMIDDVGRTYVAGAGRANACP